MPPECNAKPVVATTWIDRAVTLESLVPLDADDAFAIGNSLARIVAGAHAAGVVHRDISPANILVDPDDRQSVWLVDWELASVDGVRVFGPVGTRGFMAPELLALRIDGGLPTTPKVDVFGLGASIYYAVTGEVPYGRHVLQIIDGQRLDVSAFSPEHGRILLGMLATDPSRRPTLTREAPLQAPQPASGGAGPRPTPQPCSIDAVLELVDEGELVAAARHLGRIGVNSRADAALGYAYLASSLGDAEVTVPLALQASSGQGLRQALLSPGVGQPAPAHSALGWSARARRVHAQTLLGVDDWIGATLLVDTNAPDRLTKRLIRRRLDTLTARLGQGVASSELGYWAGVLAFDDDAPARSAILRELACRAYPGPGHDPSCLSDHMAVVTAWPAYPEAVASVATHLAATDSYPAHYRVGLWLGPATGPIEAVAASLIELGWRRLLLRLVADLPADAWRLRTQLLLACGSMDAARQCLEGLCRKTRQGQDFYQLHMAQLLHAGRPHVAINVYERALAEIGAAAHLDALGAVAYLRARRVSDALSLVDRLRAYGDPMAAVAAQVVTTAAAD